MTSFIRWVLRSLSSKRTSTSPPAMTASSQTGASNEPVAVDPPAETVDARNQLLRPKEARGTSAASASLVAISTALSVIATLVALAVSVGSAEVWSLWAFVAVLAVTTLTLFMVVLATRFTSRVVLLSALSAVVLPACILGAVVGFVKAREELECSQVDEIVERGKDYAEEDNPNRAISLFTDAIEKCPKPRVYLYRGQALSVKGQETVAIDDLTIAINTMADDEREQLVGSYLKRGQMYLLQGECDKAAADLVSAIELDSRFDPAYHNLAVTRASQGILDDPEVGGALQHINTAIDLNSSQAVYSYPRAQIYAALGRTEEAMAEADAAIRSATEDEGDTKAGAEELLAALRAGEDVDSFPPCANDLAP